MYSYNVFSLNLQFSEFCVKLVIVLTAFLFHIKIPVYCLTFILVMFIESLIPHLVLNVGTNINWEISAKVFYVISCVYVCLHCYCIIHSFRNQKLLSKLMYVSMCIVTCYVSFAFNSWKLFCRTTREMYWKQVNEAEISRKWLVNYKISVPKA